MSIDKEGFLSADISGWITKHRQDNARWFLFTHALNLTAQKIMSASTAPVSSQTNSQLSALLYFARALSGFQAVLLLAERGMVVEARTLARSCLETLFFLSAVAKKDEAFCEALIASDYRHRQKAANALLQHHTDHMETESQDKLRMFKAEVDAMQDLKDLQIEQTARDGGQHDLYVFYRQFSGDAAHPLIGALHRYLPDADQPNPGPIIWGPKCGADEISDTLGLASSFLLGVCDIVCEKFSFDDLRAEVRSQFESYKNLLGQPSAAG